MTRFGSCLCAAAAIALGGCTTLPPRPTLEPSLVAPPAEQGPLHDYSARIDSALGPEKSAHWLLDGNELALNARLALTDEAVSTLDVQYFIWQNDATSQLLAARLLDAANRGVKIRLLLDDFTVTTGRTLVVGLDAHPNIEVRVFNPWASRGSRFGVALEFLGRAKELNHRMHNKTYIADNRFAIIGGRNIGDRYFGLYESFVQDDLDVLLAGEVVADVSNSFDEFWNSAHSFPLTAFGAGRDEGGGAAHGEGGVAALESRLEGTIASESRRLASFPLERADWTSFLDGLVTSYAPAESDFFFDSPDVWNPSAARLYPRFKALVASAEHEVLISSPYFIPDADFRELIRSLVARGVRVAIMTNSLATNSHVVAHTGYKRWRRDVLAAGAELYEMREDATAIRYYVTPPATTKELGLHTKAVVVDGKRAFVGSPNVDPRSMRLNTEIGVVSESEEVARRVAALIERDMSAENAWRVTMDEEGWLTWSSGGETRHRQPAKGFAQRAVEFLLNLLPLKDQA